MLWLSAGDGGASYNTYCNLHALDRNLCPSEGHGGTQALFGSLLLLMLALSVAWCLLGACLVPAWCLVSVSCDYLGDVGVDRLMCPCQCLVTVLGGGVHKSVTCM
jgi:hypothetical protein